MKIEECTITNCFLGKKYKGDFQTKEYSTQFLYESIRLKDDCITICITILTLPATVFSCSKYQNGRGNRI